MYDYLIGSKDMCLTLFYIALENVIIMKYPFDNALFILSNRIDIELYMHSHVKIILCFFVPVLVQSSTIFAEKSENMQIINEVT